MRLISIFAAVYSIAMLSAANAGPQQASLEDRYITLRDAAIAKSSKLYDAGKFDDAAQKAEDAARSNLQAQMAAILAESNRGGFGPPQLNLDAFYAGDQGFGQLDGLRFDAETGVAGEKAGGNGADGKYVEPKAHIVITTERLFEHWLRAHKNWWDKGVKNVPQQIASAIKDESFYTQAISTDAAVINFNALPVAKPADATFAYGFLAGRTQSEIPDSADEVFVTAIARGKVYVAYGSIEPAVKVPACTAARTEANKKAEDGDEKFRLKQIDKKTYDRLGDQRQQAEDAFRRCFAQRAPQQAAFAAATRQAQALLDTALGK